MMSVKAVKLKPGSKALEPDVLREMIAGTTIALHRARKHSKDCSTELNRLLKIYDEHGGE